MRLFYLAVCLGLVATTAAGLILMSRASDLPAFSDPARVAELRRIDDYPAPDEWRARTAAWQAELRPFVTGKWDLYDRGRTLAWFGGSALLGLLSFRLCGVRSVRDLRTPRYPLVLYPLGALSLVVLGRMPLAFSREMDARGLCPPWNCTDGIDEVAAYALTLAAIPFVAGIAWLSVLRLAQPSVPLWIWDRARPARSWRWTIVHGGLAVWVVVAMARSLWNGNHLAAPVGLVWLYLALVGRALVVAAPAQHDLAPGADPKAATVANPYSLTDWSQPFPRGLDPLYKFFWVLFAIPLWLWDSWQIGAQGRELPGWPHYALAAVPYVALVAAPFIGFHGPWRIAAIASLALGLLAQGWHVLVLARSLESMGASGAVVAGFAAILVCAAAYFLARTLLSLLRR